jgi:hypothetical protein
MTGTGTVVAALLAALLTLATAGLAQGPGLVEFKSDLNVRYTAIVPNLLQTDTGLGTGGIVLVGAEGCDGIAGWAGDSGYALKGVVSGVTNVGY